VEFLYEGIGYWDDMNKKTKIQLGFINYRDRLPASMRMQETCKLKRGINPNEEFGFEDYQDLKFNEKTSAVHEQVS
jgi:hypothetical protein